MVKVLGKGCPRHIGQGRVALFTGLEMTGVNWAVEFLQCFSSGSLGELGNWGSGCLSAVGGCLEHWIDSLWSSVL